MIYHRNSRECILCHRRKKLIFLTPEEEVRQQFISDLITKYKVPPEMISLEEHMSYFNGTGRADIIVYELDEIKNLKYPLILVECKASHIPLNDTVLSQAKAYNKSLNARLIILTNGGETKLFQKGRNEYYQIAMIPTYVELINNKKFKPKVETKTWIRPNHLKGIFREGSKLKDEGVIGGDTDSSYYSFSTNLYGLLYNLTTQLFKLNSNIFRFIKDIGLRDVSFSNAAGGSWAGHYRSFILEDDKGNHQIISVGLMGKISTKDDPLHGNSVGNTMLLVAIDNDGNSHLSLQLALDRFITIEENKISIFHNGTLTLGNKGRVKNKPVVDFVNNYRADLIKNNKIFLGTLDNSNPLTFDREDVKQFLQNLIDYAIIRDKFRYDYGR